MISNPTTVSSPITSRIRRLVPSPPDSVTTVCVDVPVTSIDVSDDADVGVRPPGWVNRLVLVVSSMLWGVSAVGSVTDVVSLVASVVSVVEDETASLVDVVDASTVVEVEGSAALVDDDDGASVTVVLTATVVEVSCEGASTSLVGLGTGCAKTGAVRNPMSTTAPASPANRQAAPREGRGPGCGGKDGV